MDLTAFTRTFHEGVLKFTVLRPRPSEVEVAVSFTTSPATSQGHTVELFTPLSVVESSQFSQTLQSALEARARQHHPATSIRRLLLKEVLPWFTENAHIVSHLVRTHPFAQREHVA